MTCSLSQPAPKGVQRKLGLGRILDNHQPPIPHLPREVLSMIFVELLQSLPARDGNVYHSHLGNLRLTCSWFREVLDSTPRAWSRIHATTLAHQKSFDMTVTLLRRSGSVLLDIYITVAKDDDPKGSLPLLDLLFRHSKRWRIFRCTFWNFVGENSEWDDAVSLSILQFAGLDAPCLGEFTVAHPGSGFHAQQLNLLGGAAPSLRRLNIGPMTIPWDSALLTGLTFLRIRAWDGSRAPTPEEYLNMLSSCPELEFIYLMGRDEQFQEELGAAFHSHIVLSKLKTLSLEFLHPDTVKSLLSSIDGDPNYLMVMFSSDLEEQWREVIEATLLEPNSIRFLSRFITSPDTIRFTGYSDYYDASPVEVTTHMDNETYLFTCGFGDSPLPIPLYRTLFSPSARAALKRLTISIGNTYFEEDFGYRELLQESDGLQEIHLVGDEGDLLDILVHLSQPLQSSIKILPEARWICPHLRRLGFSRVPLDIIDLWEFLNARYNGTAPPTPLQHLTIEGNSRYKSPSAVRMDIAHDIAKVIGKNQFVWENHYLTRSGGWRRKH